MFSSLSPNPSIRAVLASCCVPSERYASNPQPHKPSTPTLSFTSQVFLRRYGLATFARRLGQLHHFVHSRTKMLQKMLMVVRAEATRKDALPVQGLVKILIGKP